MRARVTPPPPPSIEDVLAAVEPQPIERWPALLADAFEPDVARQALIWLHARRGATASAVQLDARYERGPLLGEGHTASVWRAYDRKLRRDVAVKVFHAGDRTAVADILAEARAASDIASEHVIRVHDVHDGDTPYIVMELAGEHDPRTGALVPATSAATQRPRDVREALRWVRDIASGVHDAHLRNVFHRDLTPRNVLVTPFSRRAKLTDFGLAISAAAASSAGVRIAGTPPYMAPEQARGLAGERDHAILVAIDIWGIGAIAFDLITGNSPWPRGAGAWEAASRGDTAGITAALVRARVAPRIRHIVGKALAADPKQRYTSAAELVGEIDAILDARPTSFDRSRVTRLALWSRRNPQLSVAGVVALALAVLSFTAYATTLRLRRQRDRLAAEIDEGEREAARIEAQSRTTRSELATTEAELARTSHELEQLQRTIADDRIAAKAIAAANADLIRKADSAIRELAETRSELTLAERGRALYEGFWTRGRDEAAQTAHERDEAQRDREAARTALEQAIHERDEARAAGARAARERDDAQAQRDREAAARRRAEADLADLAALAANLKLVPADAGAAPPTAPMP